MKCCIAAKKQRFLMPYTSACVSQAMLLVLTVPKNQRYLSAEGTKEEINAEFYAEFR
ncbi:hypothetical protein ACYULU_03725 [Breznakiellaceae bacterium SP9]